MLAIRWTPPPPNTPAWIFSTPFYCPEVAPDVGFRAWFLRIVIDSTHYKTMGYGNRSVPYCGSPTWPELELVCLLY